LDLKDLARLGTGDDGERELGGRRKLQVRSGAARRGRSETLARRVGGLLPFLSEPEDCLLRGTDRRAGLVGVRVVDLEDRKTLRATHFFRSPSLESVFVVLVPRVAAVALDDQRGTISRGARGSPPPKTSSPEECEETRRISAMTRGIVSSASDTSSSVVRRDREKRTTHFALSRERPSARIAGDGSSVPLEQALPVEAAMPSRSSRITR